MNNLRSCHSCQCIMMRRNADKVDISGALTCYMDNLKTYVKPCCLFAYYFGNPDVMSDMIKQAIPSRIKTRAPKYVVMDDVSFVVYDLASIKKNEKTSDPNSCNSLDKISITRNVYLSASPEQYTIMTKSAYERFQKKLTKINNAAPNPADTTVPQYVYLIQERTAVVANQSIFKIGRTEQINFERFKGYVKGYRVLLHMMCDNCRDTEAAIMKHFKFKYRQATEYGSEYFEGNWKNMRSDIFAIVDEYSMIE